MNKKNILFIVLMIFSLNSITFSLADEYTQKYFNKVISIIADVNLTEFESEKRLKDKLKHPIFKEVKKQNLQYDFEILNKQNTDEIKQNLEDEIDLTPPTDNFIENENKLQDEKENENLKIFNENYQVRQLPSQQFLQENIKNDEIKLNQNNFNILKDISKLNDIQENNIENQPIKKSISYLEYIKENPDFENQYIPKKSKYQNNNSQKIQKLNLELTKEDIEKIIN